MLEDIVEIPIGKVTTEDVREAYKLFLEAYKIKYNEQWLEDCQQDIVRVFEKNKDVDYRPYMKAKFFVSNHITTISFHGYSDAIDPWSSRDGREPKWYKKEKTELKKQQEEFNKEFQRKIREYFKNQNKI